MIYEFDGKQIDRMRTLPRMVAETAIGKEVEVRLWRKGEDMTLRVTLGELPEDEQIAELGPAEPPSPTGDVKIEPLGMTLAAITPELKSQYSIPDTAKGLVVTEVAPDSPASDESLRPGDLVVEVAQEPVTSPSEALTRVNQAKKDKKSVLLLIDRQGDLRFVALRFKE